MEDPTAAGVFDLGSKFVKVGFAGESEPLEAFPSVVGRFQGTGVMIGLDWKSTYVGNEALQKRGILRLSSSFIDKGVITNFDDFSQCLNHGIYNVLRIAPEEHPLLYTRPTLRPELQEEKVAQITFEELNAQAVAVCPDDSAVLFRSGRLSGLSVSLGDKTSVTGVFEGTPVEWAAVSNSLPEYWTTLPEESGKKRSIGGRELQAFLLFLLMKDEHNKNYSYSAKCSLEDIIAKHVQCARTHIEGMDGTAAPKEYELPDGTTLKLAYNSYLQCTEAYFSPVSADFTDETFQKDHCPRVVHCGGRAYTGGSVDNAERSWCGIQDSVASVVTALSNPPSPLASSSAAGTYFSKIPKEIVSKIESKASPCSQVCQFTAVSGGNASIPGFIERLKKEIAHIGVVTTFESSPPNPHTAVWSGASIIAELSTFKNLLISKAQYDEIGPKVINWK